VHLSTKALAAGIVVFVLSAGVGAGGFLIFRDDTSHRRTPSAPFPDRSGSPGRFAPDPRTLGRTTAATQGAKPLLSLDAAADFAALRASSGGRLGIAVAPLGRGPLQVLGDLASGHAWSTMKVPVLVTLLGERGGQGGLSTQESTWARSALTESNNQAATGLFSALERVYNGLVGASEAVQQILRRAGDDTTEVNTSPNRSGFTTFGQTLWSADAATRFYRALARGCLLSPADTAYVLALMSEVAPDQRWGMGEANLDGAALSFKGGWGPENGGAYLVRQTAVVGSRNRGYTVSILAQPTSSDGSYAQGARLVSRAADWVARHVNPRLERPLAYCR
jgi:hypothetical protein